MICNIFFLYRSESTKSDMKCNVAKLYAHILDFFQELFGKMEPCRRRRRRRAG